MNAAETFNALARYNSWRRGDDTIEQPNAAELGATIDDAVNLLRKFANMREERDELRAEVERLKADAARLDWLENAKSAEYREGARGWSLNGWSGPYSDTIREAIDAAMKGDA